MAVETRSTDPGGSPLRTASPGSWPARRASRRNRFDAVELAGAFGDLGTLIPFVVGYIAVVGVDPLGLLFMLGVSQIATGLYYRTPVPVQPMKAIGGAAIASGGAIGAGMVWGAGLVTGLFWLAAGTTRAVDLAAKLAAKPVVRGIVLGLGLLFIAEGVRMMLVTPWLGAFGLVLTFTLLARTRLPAMFALLLLGAGAIWILDPDAARQVLSMRPDFRLPSLTLGRISWGDIVAGATILALPQLPLTFGNAVLAIRAENNDLFPERPVTDRMLAISQGAMNLACAPVGGIPLCHGAGGMAGHVRFGARTGGALVMLGALMIGLALFFSSSVGFLFQVFPKAVLGVMLFFAGAELAATIRDVGRSREDIYVMIVVAGVAMWNMGAAFLAGVALYHALRRGWIRL